MKKDTTQQFKKAVIESIHGMPYKEAIKKELVAGSEIDITKLSSKYAIADRYSKLNTSLSSDSSNYEEVEVEEIIHVENDPKKDCIYILGKYSEQLLCINKEDLCNEKVIIKPLITIGRVMQALSMHGMDYACTYASGHKSNICRIELEDGSSVFWQLTKENGQEATDDDQKIEDIEKLLNLLQK